jgi:outer membrane lipoprotein-sorting protein
MIPNYCFNLTFKQSWIKTLNLKVLFCVLLSWFLISYSNASESQDELIIRAEKSIKNISTLQAEFTQISSDGSYAIGKLYFRRPFQMRLEYNVEKPFNLITTRNLLIVDEPENKQITNYPLSETPLAFLLEEDFSLTANEFLTQSMIHNGLAEISLRKETGDRAGELILLFEPNQMNLRGWKIIDAIGMETKVTLQNEIYGGDLPNKLFGRPIY